MSRNLTKRSITDGGTAEQSSVKPSNATPQNQSGGTRGRNLVKRSASGGAENYIGTDVYGVVHTHASPSALDAILTSSMNRKRDEDEAKKREEERKAQEEERKAQEEAEQEKKQQEEKEEEDRRAAEDRKRQWDEWLA
uniref:Uncharacterized protein n=1 Tax=viral metagenome TaxID=1070528 RepID=A0A2V0RAS9_9ZZZZ